MSQKDKSGFIFCFIQSSILLNFFQHLPCQHYILIYFYRHLQQYLSHHRVMSLSANQTSICLLSLDSQQKLTDYLICNPRHII